MKLTSMQKMLLAIAAAAVLVIAAVVLLVVPKFAEMSALDAERETAADLVNQTQAQLAQLRQAAGNASVTQAQLIGLANQFPENPELPSVIIELQDAANASGVTFDQFAPGVPIAGAGAQYTDLPLTVTVQGTWSDVLDYLRRLNHMTRAVRVSDVSMTPVAPTITASTTVVPETKVLLALTMRAFVMGVNGVVPSAASSATPAPAPQPAP
jgi:type IV pilus assembly protein PilO